LSAVLADFFASAKSDSPLLGYGGFEQRREGAARDVRERQRVFMFV